MSRLLLSIALTKASTNVEYLICDSVELSDLDSNMASQYRALRSHDDSILQNQRNWLRHERNKCETHNCLVNAYDERLRYFDSLNPKFTQEEYIPEVAAAKQNTGSNDLLNTDEKIELMSLASDFKSNWPLLSMEEKVDNCYELPIKEAAQSMMVENLYRIQKDYLFLDDAEKEIAKVLGMLDSIEVGEMLANQNGKIVFFLQQKCAQIF